MSWAVSVSEPNLLCPVSCVQCTGRCVLFNVHGLPAMCSMQKNIHNSIFQPYCGSVVRRPTIARPCYVLFLVLFKETSAKLHLIFKTKLHVIFMRTECLCTS
ncbi:hypothetical protein SKAU_G00107560 [Synaphobranchus kaupii]|uniref:Uncharacterized protein n=1 Tax=Synaphobranchus kaupii TaxID=118154 RepID=A0A9Q1J835_SYNKA|nr:hypothetical protein SKAU_G00107560 [Synaphobranchus kaupii]